MTEIIFQVGANPRSPQKTKGSPHEGPASLVPSSGKVVIIYIFLIILEIQSSIFTLLKLSSGLNRINTYLGHI